MARQKANLLYFTFCFCLTQTTPTQQFNFLEVRTPATFHEATAVCGASWFTNSGQEDRNEPKSKGPTTFQMCFTWISEQTVIIPYTT
jgi:hypothetical protein